WALEVHQYLDSDSSGTKREVVAPDVGSKRLTAFVEWCRQRKMRAFLGEFAVPATPMGREALANMMESMQRDSDVWLGWTWWAAGAWWGNYMFSIEPGADGSHKPQMEWLRPYLHGAEMPAFRVSVEGGEGSGMAKPCAKHAVRAAQPPNGMVFDGWTGDAVWLDDPQAARATLTMPFKEVRLTARFRAAAGRR
ncbi:MAG: cellulase family glycosylhydrolase, partial [Armatimonadota bacterium]|nr:cellulase family glycosylhydrolase [Armatimonadota bacterium]